MRSAHELDRIRKEVERETNKISRKTRKNADTVTGASECVLSNFLIRNSSLLCSCFSFSLSDSGAFPNLILHQGALSLLQTSLFQEQIQNVVACDYPNARCIVLFCIAVIVFACRIYRSRKAVFFMFCNPVFKSLRPPFYLFLSIYHISDI